MDANDLEPEKSHIERSDSGSMMRTNCLHSLLGPRTVLPRLSEPARANLILQQCGILKNMWLISATTLSQTQQ